MILTSLTPKTSDTVSIITSFTSISLSRGCSAYKPLPTLYFPRSTSSPTFSVPFNLLSTLYSHFLPFPDVIWASIPHTLYSALCIPFSTACNFSHVFYSIYLAMDITRSFSNLEYLMSCSIFSAPSRFYSPLATFYTFRPTTSLTLHISFTRSPAVHRAASLPIPRLVTPLTLSPAGHNAVHGLWATSASRH